MPNKQNHFMLVRFFVSIMGHTKLCSLPILSSHSFVCNFIDSVQRRNCLIYMYVNLQLLRKHLVSENVYFHIGPPLGACWLSDKASDTGTRGQGVETYLRRDVSLSKALYSQKVPVMSKKWWFHPD